MLACFFWNCDGKGKESTGALGLDSDLSETKKLSKVLDNGNETMEWRIVHTLSMEIRLYEW